MPNSAHFAQRVPDSGIGPVIAPFDPADLAIDTHPALLRRLKGQHIFTPSTGRTWLDSGSLLGYAPTPGITNAAVALNGHKAATFGGGDKVPLGAIMPTAGTPWSAYLVVRCAATDDMALLASSLNGDGHGGWFDLRISGGKAQVDYQGSVVGISDAYDPTKWHLIEVHYRITGDGNQATQIKIDGVNSGSEAVIVNDAGHQNLHSTIFLGQLDGYGFQFKGDLAQFLLFGACVNTTNPEIATFLKSYYGIA